MPWGWLADAVAVLHALFVLFVVCGWVVVLRWPRAAWVHLPAAAWGALIEFGGWICPLTPLELRFRSAAREAGYHGGFVEHYIFRLIYPEGLTREMQIALGVLVLAVNAAAYAFLLRRRRRAPA